MDNRCAFWPAVLQIVRHPSAVTCDRLSTMSPAVFTSAMASLVLLGVAIKSVSAAPAAGLTSLCTKQGMISNSVYVQ